MQLVEIEVIATGTRALLPAEVAYQMVEAGRARLLPDQHYPALTPTPVLHTWGAGKLSPTRPTRLTRRD